MKGYKIILCMLEVVIFLCFSYVGDTQAQVNPQQTLFYQATPRTHSWTVNGTTYNNNRNPFGIEMNVCIIGGRPDLYPKTIQDACIPQSVTINGNKWWRGSSGVGISCRELQPQYDGPRQWTDSRTTSGTGQQNINLPVCTAVKDQRSTVNFIDVSKQFTYYSTLCQNGNQVVLAPRADIYDPECQNINYNTIIGNPQNYSQRQRSCLLFADDQADITACKNGVCKTHTYHPDDPPRGRLIPTTYENVCSIFSQGDGTYNVSVEVYDTGQVVYGSSSLYLTWLSNSITGNVFIDTNKNGIKDASESNYLGPISLTVDGNNITIPTGGRYTIPNLRPETTHTISYTSLPTDYIMSYPLNGPPSTYQVTVGSSCTTNGALGATCTGDINNLNFAITDSFPWIQTTCGDVRIDNGVTNEVPIGQTMIKTNTSCTSPGVVFTGDTRAEFGKGQASSSNQVVGGTNYPEVYDAAKTQTVFSSYANLLGKAQSADITPINLATVCTLANCTLPANLPHGIYQANGNVALNSHTFVGNRNYVFLINGTLTIRGNILVPAGSNSSVLFATADNIIIPSTVGSSALSTSPNLSGIYSTDRSFILQSTNTCNDLRLNLEGTLIINAARNGGSLQNSRDLCGNNPVAPTMQITQRLDFVLNLPDFIRSQQVISKEVAP